MAIILLWIILFIVIIPLKIIFQKSKLIKTLYISITPTPFQRYWWGGSGPVGGCIGILFASESSNSLVDEWCEASGGDSDIDVFAMLLIIV